MSDTPRKERAAWRYEQRELALEIARLDGDSERKAFMQMRIDELAKKIQQHPLTVYEDFCKAHEAQLRCEHCKTPWDEPQSVCESCGKSA